MQTKTLYWLSYCSLYSFLPLQYMAARVCLCLCSTAKWDRSIYCGCYATQVPTRQCGHTWSHFQDRLREKMSHPEFNPTLPREALKVCHPWQQPYISWGSLCYVFGTESGCSFSYDLCTFIFFWESGRISSTECTADIKVTMSLKGKQKGV